MAQSARPTSTNLLTELVTQVAHGFSVGDLVINDALLGPPNYVYSQANTVGDSFGTMMVSIVVDANDFYVTQVGYVSGLTANHPIVAGGLIAGTSYWLSPAAANTLITAAPTGAAQVILGCFKADSATSGFFFGGSGTVVTASILFAWTVETANANMATNNGYISNSAGTINLTLPTTANIGDIIRVTNEAGNFSIRQNAGQSINFGNVTTTVGTTGHLDSTALGDSVELVCIVAGANTTWQVQSVIGNLTIV